MSKKRKLFSGIAILLVIALMTSLFPLGVFADGATVTDAVYGDSSVADAVYGDSSVTDSVYGGVSVTSAVYDSDPSHFTYRISGSGATITGYTGPGGDVIIPDSIDGYQVTAIEDGSATISGDTIISLDSAFGGKGITSVIIPNSITYIGNYAFADNMLTTVVIPDSVEYIGEWAFADNQLTAISLPSINSSDYAFRIGDYAFTRNRITTVSFPDISTEIGKSAFSDNQLTSVSFPQNADYLHIGESSFARNQITSIDLPNISLDIGNWAFADNELTEIDIPFGVDMLKMGVFQNNKLVSVTIPETVVYIEEYFDPKTDPFYSPFLGNQVNPSDLTIYGYKGTWAERHANLYNYSFVALPPREIKVYVNYELVEFPDVQPFLSTTGRAMIPIRFVNEKLGAEVWWDQDSKKATIDRLANPGQESEMKVRIEMVVGADHFTVNGVDYPVDTSIQLVEGDRIVLPGAYIAQPYPDVYYEFRDRGAYAEAHFFINRMPNDSDPSDKYDLPLTPITPVPITDFPEPDGELVSFPTVPTPEEPDSKYRLTILEPLGQGSVFPTVGTHEYLAGETVSLSAINSAIDSVPGYAFEKWVIDGEDVFYPNPDVVMDRDHVAQAVFKPILTAQYTLTVNQIGNGNVSPTGVSYHNPADLVTLTANPAAGNKFVKWVVNGVEFYNPVLTITMNTDTVATAYFELLTQLTLSVNQVGEGNVSPAGVSKFYEFETVELTANPADGYKFVKWVVNGKDVLNANFTLTMVEDTTAIAYFEPLPPKEPRLFTLTVNQVGEGTITPSSSDGKLVYKENEKVVLNAEPADGYQFVKWVVDGQEYTDAEITIKMDKDKTATAYFEKVTPPPVIKGKITVEFRDSVTNEKIKEDEVLTDLDLGEHSYIAETQIGVYELVGEALKKVVLTVAEPIQKITYFYKEKVITPPADDDPVEPPAVQEPPTPPVVEKPADPPVVQEPPTPPVVKKPADPPVVQEPPTPPVVEEPPVVKQLKEPIGNEKPVVEAPVADQPVEKAPELDQVRIVAIDVETDEVLTEEILRDLPLGKHEISAPAVEGYEALDPSMQNVTVEAQGRQLVVEFRYHKLNQFGTVYGVVLDKDGNPMEGIQVELHSDPRVTYTNANGEYKFENVELGQHTVILKNPFTKEEIGKVEIVVYQDIEQKNSRTVSLKDASEIRTVIELNELENTRRVDFIIEPIKSEDSVPQIPQQPEPIEPKSKLPIIPIAVTSLPFIVAVIVYFRRKNVVIMNEDGLVIKKLRLKAKPETVIDLTSLEASTFIIQFKNPAPFREVKLFVKHRDDLTPVKMQDGQSHIEFEL